MSETEESKSFLRKQWEEYKIFRYSLDSSVVEEFIASDPVNGITLKTVSEAADFASVCKFVGAYLTTMSSKWSRGRLHGVALSLAFGGAVGGTLGAVIAIPLYQLDRLDPHPVAAQVKFKEWLQKRASGES